MPGLGIAPLGPVGGVAIAGPTMLSQATDAAAQIPEKQREAQLQQATVDHQNFANVLERLPLFNPMLANNPGLAGDPNMIKAYQLMYGKIGVPVPMHSEGGRQTLDTNALGAFEPGRKWLAENWKDLQLMDPQARESLWSSLGFGQAPQGLLSLPRKYLQSPGEAISLLTSVRSMVQSIGKPGGTSVDNVAAYIDAISLPLKDIGITSDMLIQQLKPDIYAQLLEQAKLNLLNAQTNRNTQQGALDAAKAEVAIKELPARLRLINNTADLKQVMEDYFPQMAAAAGQKADAATEDAATRAGRMASQNARDWGAADEAHRKAESLHQATEQGLAGGVKNSASYLATLQRDAHEADDRADKLHKSLEQALLDAETYKDTPYGKQAKSDADQYARKEAEARADAAKSRALYTRMRDQSTHGSQAKPPPHDMRPGTMEHYQALDAAGKKAYVANPNVPKDVRDYLESLPASP